MHMTESQLYLQTLYSMIVLSKMKELCNTMQGEVS